MAARTRGPDSASPSERWTGKDPVLFAGVDTNLFAYTLNEPVNLVDLWGRDPGDSFATPNEAAIAAISEINPRSIRESQEFGGTIYQRNGRFSYTTPNAGGGSSVVTASAIPPGAKDVGRYHTHGSTQNYTDEDFSDGPKGDIKLCRDRGTPSWLGTPKGAIKKAIPTKRGFVIIDLVAAPGQRPNIRFVPNP
jgi:hypothetical protein